MPIYVYKCTNPECTENTREVWSAKIPVQVVCEICWKEMERDYTGSITPIFPPGYNNWQTMGRISFEEKLLIVDAIQPQYDKLKGLLDHAYKSGTNKRIGSRNWHIQ